MKGQAGEGSLIEIAASAIDNGATVPLPVTDVDTPEGRERVVLIDPEYVRAMVASIVKDQDLSRYIL
jgi:ATP-dependent HslUV protease ATP-binding subunit HslU